MNAIILKGVALHKVAPEPKQLPTPGLYALFYPIRATDPDLLILNLAKSTSYGAPHYTALSSLLILHLSSAPCSLSLSSSLNVRDTQRTSSRHYTRLDPRHRLNKKRHIKHIYRIIHTSQYSRQNQQKSHQLVTLRSFFFKFYLQENNDKD
jgi:hypothetical protein